MEDVGNRGNQVQGKWEHCAIFTIFCKLKIYKIKSFFKNV